jgi:peptidoglycan/LPS O-acetylase OafA/YrhL
MTYSIYLVHAPVIDILGRGTSELFASYSSGTILLQAALLAPAVLAAGLLFYVTIERPCMNPRWPVELRRRLFPHARSSPHRESREEAIRA